MIGLVGESKLVRRINACGSEEVNHHIGIVGKDVPAVHIASHVERTGGKGFLAGRSGKAEVVVNDFIKLLGIGVTVHLLVLNNLGDLGFLFRIKLIDFCAGILLDLANHRLIHQERKHLRNLLLDGSLVGIHLGHEQRHDVVDGGGKALLVAVRKIADHKQHIYYPTIESLLLLILNQIQCLTCIRHGTLPQMLHGALEHGTKETVKGDKFTHLTLGGFLGDGERDVEQGTLVSLYLLVHIVHVDKGVEHLHNQLELVRYKGIERRKICLIFVRLVSAWQNKLRIEHGFILFIEFL